MQAELPGKQTQREISTQKVCWGEVNVIVFKHLEGKQRKHTRQEKFGVNPVAKEASINTTGNTEAWTILQCCPTLREVMSLYFSIMLIECRLPLGNIHDLK